MDAFYFWLHVAQVQYHPRVCEYSRRIAHMLILERRTYEIVREENLSSQNTRFVARFLTQMETLSLSKVPAAFRGKLNLMELGLKG